MYYVYVWMDLRISVIKESELENGDEDVFE
jgi:hypothetical protein